MTELGPREVVVALDGVPFSKARTLSNTAMSEGAKVKIKTLGRVHGLRRCLSAFGERQSCIDFKINDIPDTAGDEVDRMSREIPFGFEPWGYTVHASGGGPMVSAFVREFRQWSPLTKILAVTLLTSIDEEECPLLHNRTPIQLVLAWAKRAMDCGAHGLVCSPHEVAFLRNQYPHAYLMVPGIRGIGASVRRDDQERIGTPDQVFADGANAIVVGRPITRAQRPRIIIRNLVSTARKYD